MGLKNILFLLLGLITFFSCEKDSLSSDILDQAQNLAESNPSQALDLLYDISDPKNMDREEYMKYIVTLVQTKFKTGQDITNDTLIFEAAKHFENNHKYYIATKAHLYAGLVYERQQMFDKAICSYLKSNNNARECEDHLFSGRSLNNIGYIYFQQDLMDSAIVYYKKALDIFEIIPNMELSQMVIITNIASSYEITHNYDQANLHLKEGIEIARVINNTEYKSKFLHLLGNISYGKKEYHNAIKYFDQAIKETNISEDSLKMYLNLSMTYKYLNNLDSAQYYKKLVEDRLPEITDNYMLQSVCNSFSNYYNQTGNHREAAKYMKLEKEVRAHIEAKNQADKVQAANHKYYMQQQRKRFEASEQKQNIYLLLLSGTVVLILALFALFIYILRKRLPKFDDEILWRGYMHSVDQTNVVDYGEWTTRMLLLDRQSHYYTPDEETLSKKDLWEIKNMLMRNGLYTREQYVEWAKKYFSGYPEVDKIIGPLTDQQIVLFAMCLNGFSEPEKRNAFKVSKTKLIIYHNELELALLKANYLSRARIALMMYYEG